MFFPPTSCFLHFCIFLHWYSLMFFVFAWFCLIVRYCSLIFVWMFLTCASRFFDFLCIFALVFFTFASSNVPFCLSFLCCCFPFLSICTILCIDYHGLSFMFFIFSYIFAFECFLYFVFSPTTSSVAQGSLAQITFGAIWCSFNARFRGRFRYRGRWGSGGFRCRYLGEVLEGSSANAEVRFRKVPMQRLGYVEVCWGQVPEGFGVHSLTYFWLRRYVTTTYSNIQRCFMMFYVVFLVICVSRLGPHQQQKQPDAACWNEPGSSEHQAKNSAQCLLWRRAAAAVEKVRKDIWCRVKGRLQIGTSHVNISSIIKRSCGHQWLTWSDWFQLG